MSKTRVVNHRDEAYDVFIGRPTLYGNPFVIGPDGTREDVLALYRQHLEDNPDIVDMAVRDLSDSVLGCYCKPEACHGDVLIEFMENAI